MAVAYDGSKLTLHTYKITQTSHNTFDILPMFETDLGFDVKQREHVHIEALSDLYLLVTTCPLTQDIYAYPRITIYRAGDHKLTFENSYKKYMFGYFPKGYLQNTYD